MKTTAIIVLSALLITSVALHFLRYDPSVPSDPGKETRDSTENRSNVDLSNSVRGKQWADSVIQRAADIANSRDRGRIVTNTENYARSKGLDTMSFKLTTRH